MITRKFLDNKITPAVDSERVGGSWHNLPHELVDKILLYLADVDMCGYIMIASKSTFTPSEVVFKYLCELIYLKQTRKKQLNVNNWGNSWKRMVIFRPRLRLNGYYSLRTMYTKAYCNDAFWEEKKLESIEVRFYRQMRFFENGRMLYSLDVADPQEMARLLQPGLPVRNRIYEGSFLLQGSSLSVRVRLHYCVMFFEMQILDADDGWVGKHNMLRILRHESTPLHHGDEEEEDGEDDNGGAYIHNNNNNNNQQRVSYSLPINADLRFQRYWSFSFNQSLTSNNKI